MLSFEGELDENSAVRKGGGTGHINLGAAEHKIMAVADALYLRDNNKLIVGSLPLLSNICVPNERQLRRRRSLGRQKVFSLILVLSLFLRQLPKRVNFTGDCCPSAAIPNNNQPGNMRKNSRLWRGDIVKKKKRYVGGREEMSTGQQHPSD